MLKRRRLNCILVVIAVLCPIIYYVGCMTIFIPEGCHSEFWSFFWGKAGQALMMGAGPIGCVSALACLIVNRKKYRLFGWLIFLILLLINFNHVHPFQFHNESHFPFSYENMGRILWPSRSCFSYQVQKRYTGKATAFISSHQRQPLHLTFENCDITDNDIALLPDATFLKEIYFINCPNLTGDFVQSLVRYPRLTTIVLRDNPQLTDVDFSVLADHPRLRFLSVARCENITEQSLVTISRLKRLEWLEISFSSNVTDTVLSKLSILRHLKYLSLGRCSSVSARGIKTLHELPLTSISLSSSLWNDQGIESVTVFKNLKTLYIETDASASGPPLTDEGILKLGKLRKLRLLCIYRSETASLPQQGCSLLKKENPKCKIEIRKM